MQLLFNCSINSLINNLIEYIVSPSLSGEVEDGVEALGALLDENFPPAVVVPLPAQPVHLTNHYHSWFYFTPSANFAMLKCF